MIIASSRRQQRILGGPVGEVHAASWSMVVPAFRPWHRVVVNFWDPWFVFCV